MAAALSAGAGEAAPQKMSRAVLEDKVRGGWAGQMIGVAFGAPTEFKSNGRILEGELKWTPDMISNTIHQDDLYVEMTFAEVMDRVGLPLIRADAARGAAPEGSQNARIAIGFSGPSRRASERI